MRRALAFLVSVSLLVALSAPGIAAASAAGASAKQITLKPDPAQTDVVLDEVVAILDSNGVTIRATQKVRPGESGEYVLDADLKAGTYSTKLKDRKFAPVTPMALTNYAYFIEITTYDPVNFPLCRTRSTLTWTLSSSMAVVGATGTKEAQAYNPTGANTHWYNDVNNWDPAPSYDSGSAWDGVTASYYNYDFQDPTQPTHVTHKENLWGYPDGSAQHSYQHTYSGEYYWLLHSLVKYGFQ